ncbi:MAG TPA: dienelactone hydrolase family protein [Bryobacteraceae bacterium]|jgi:dienelactone hydrolase|nr:dienelactone hydrolase family protein [Bryobacteraceae bacterium]
MNSLLIRYQDNDTPLTGFLVWDDARGDQRPGILVVHGGAGLDDHAKERARRLASLGYVAFACDMYGDGVAGDRQRVMARIMELRDDPERLCRRAQAGIHMLASRPEADGRLAAVGYCFGGMTVLQLARNGAELAGVVSVHGSLKTSVPAQPSQMKAKVLVCHGALDPHVPMTDVTAFSVEMNRADADWQLLILGGAMHGFTHEDAAQSNMPGVAYHAVADARSSAAIKMFLAELFNSH